MFRATARLLRSRLAVSKGDGAGGAGLTLSGNALMRGERADVTVIWCHGLGDTAEGMAGLFVADGITFQSDAVKVVLPTASSNPVTLNNGMLMPSWYDITGLDRTTACNQQDLWASVQRVQKLVDQEHAETKVVVGGFSQGGAVALSAALQSSSDNLVAIIAASCYLPLDLDSFDGEAVKRFMPNRALSRPVCVCHGDEDLTVRFLARTFDVEQGEAPRRVESVPTRETARPPPPRRVFRGEGRLVRRRSRKKAQEQGRVYSHRAGLLNLCRTQRVASLSNDEICLGCKVKPEPAVAPIFRSSSRRLETAIRNGLGPSGIVFLALGASKGHVAEKNR
ncbi:Phospholipase/Carboxylesterase-domain-containing protein [Pelagophyceae sp. CCMP2097]|nr:Phospholipase/Carboxylesterase-domain-containing protein [Pelagophyceae sp. CCMP2097]